MGVVDHVASLTMAEGDRAAGVDGRLVRWAPVFAFFGSGCLLVLELVAARLIAPTLGVSLYTWTSVIGVVLGGVSLGNYVGGRVADRWPSRSVLAMVYASASASSLLVLGLLPHVPSFDLPVGSPPLLQVLWVTAVLFLLPSTILGVPTPLLTRMSLEAIDHTGRVVGRIQAAATAGSIVGTFATGFFLISWFGTRAIVCGVAAVLLILALAIRSPLFHTRGPWIASPLLVAIVLTGWYATTPCTTESNYYCLRVSPGTVSTIDETGQTVRIRPPIQRLYLDSLIHSQVDLANPTNLLYGYEQLYADVLTELFPDRDDLRTMGLGGGGYTFPRYLDVVYGAGSTTVAEIDPAVTRTALDFLGFSPSPRVRLVEGDARLILHDMDDDERFDAILGDAFNDYGVPYHLATREFDELVSDHLTDDGVYLLNLIDAVDYDFLRSTIRTLREVFPYVALAVGSWPARGVRDTFVLVAANRTPATSPSAAVDADQLDAFVEAGHSVILTDDHVPVEQLLAPVFAQALHEGR